MIRLLTILLLSCLSLNAAIPIIFTRPGTNAVITETNLVETDIFQVESEDFNSTNGLYFPGTGGQPFGEKYLYDDKGATFLIDYFILPVATDNIYRAANVDVGTSFTADGYSSHLFSFPSTFNHEWSFATRSNDWANYTRAWTNYEYHVYARMAHAETNMIAELGLVTSDRTVSNQTVVPVGTFSNSASGGWFQFVFVPLYTNGFTEKAKVTLNGEQTVRFTHKTDHATMPNVNVLEFRRLEPGPGSPSETDALLSVRDNAAFVANRDVSAFRINQ